MGILCTCPLGAEIADVVKVTCPEIVGQVHKLVFQRKYSTGTTLNKFTIASANPNLLASWSTLLAASDGTKVTSSPLIDGPEMEPGGPKTYGGGNQTRGGVEIITGRDPSVFRCNFLNVSQQTIKALKQYFCEEMAVYFVNENGQIIGLADDNGTPLEFYPIPIATYSFFLGDKKFGGFEEPDMNILEFKLYPNWSNELYIVDPSDFDPLVSL